MSSQTWWYLARATGIVAWALLSASVIWGLLISTRLAKGRPTPAWLLDLHRFLGGTAVVFTVGHLVGLVADSYVTFDLVDLLVPFASSWKPGPVALGVVGLYLLAAVEITSLLMRRLPRKVWRAVHMSSFVLFWSATFHFALAGTDAGHPLALIGIDLIATAVVFLTLVRILAPRGAKARQAARDRSPAPDRTERIPAQARATSTDPDRTERIPADVRARAAALARKRAAGTDRTERIPAEARARAAALARARAATGAPTSGSRGQDVTERIPVTAHRPRDGGHDRRARPSGQPRRV